MAQERFEFRQTIEGLLLGAFEARGDAELLSKLRNEGLDLTANLQPAYPAAVFFRFVGVAARHRFPDQPEVDAMREVGRLAVRRGLEATLLGRAVLQAAKLLGVRRAMKRFGTVMKNGNNYIDGKVTELSPNALELELGPLVGPRSYYEGVLEECPRMLGAHDIVVTHLRDDGEHACWRVEWKD